MRPWDLTRYVLTSCVATAFLVGCGAVRQAQGDIPSVGAPGATPQSRAPATRGDSSNYKVLYSFHGELDGDVPSASLVDVDGTLYGTTQYGGGSALGRGTVFTITTGGTEKPLYKFQKGHGAHPLASLIDVNGLLYGTTYRGGQGTVFSLTTGSVEQVLHYFVGKEYGKNPYAALIDVGGALYGTTHFGGTDNYGTVFSITTSGTWTELYSFGASPDGNLPQASLLEVGGTLYGTTQSGGTYHRGTVFSITTNGTEKVLHSFGYGTDGTSPEASLINVNGTLYGTTFGGGGTGCSSFAGCGTVFSITTSGTERVLYSFVGDTDGAHPEASLIDVGGTLYGTTYGGGTYTQGTVFSISTSGTERVLHDFPSGRSDGRWPKASLIDVDGTLYGTTSYGGTHGHGTVFALAP